NFFTSSIKLCHYAPEQAILKRFSKLKNINYASTDIESHLADVKAEIFNLPYKDNEFDVILCNHVLEHVKDDKKAMAELYRVMKPGGWGIFQIPQDLKREVTFEDDSITDPKERARIFGQYDHVRIYGRDYFDKLRSAGFKVKEIQYQEQLDEKSIEKYVLNHTEIIPLCSK